MGVFDKPLMIGRSWCDMSHLDRLVNSGSICDIDGTEYGLLENVRILGYSAETFEGGLVKCSIRIEKSDKSQLFLDLDKVKNIKCGLIVDRNKKIITIAVVSVVGLIAWKTLKLLKK